MINKGKLGAVILAIIIFGGLILGLMCFERIPAGYAGIVYNMNGGIEDDPPLTRFSYCNNLE